MLRWKVMPRALRIVLALGAVGACVALLGLAAVGARSLRPRIARAAPSTPIVQAFVAPEALLPGPQRRSAEGPYVLDDGSSRRMVGMAAGNQRWCDVVGNFYASSFADAFSYTNGASGRGPVVRVHVHARGDTFRGRLEAHGLKPNFAYQMKLSGVADDPVAFERIGKAGRWLLPWGGTNFTDEDYAAYGSPHTASAYILFDFFITDAEGRAVRDFALDSSLHVLWRTSQRACLDPDAVLTAVVDASNPEAYLRPKSLIEVVGVWAEVERVRYERERRRTRFLPPGDYRAELVLTEESFHSPLADGGYWASVLRLPVAFTVTRDDA